MNQKRFRKAYVIQQTAHDRSALRGFAERIEFVFVGAEEETAMMGLALVTFQDFDPTSDVIVPVGTVLANLIAGNVLARLSQQWNQKEYSIAVYSEKQYHILTLNLDEVKETPDA